MISPSTTSVKPNKGVLWLGFVPQPNLPLLQHFSYPIEQWPACPRAQALEARRDRNIKAPELQYLQTIKEVKNYGSDLAYL